MKIDALLGSAGRREQSLPPSPFWIGFDEAESAVETIVDIAHEDQEERPTCIVLTGKSGMGKTSIVREAQRRIIRDFPEPKNWGEARFQPFIRTIIPTSPTSLKINLAILWKQGWPLKASTHRTADLKVVDLLGDQGTKMVAIDNIHAILTASGVARRDALDALRFLMSAGNVPMVIAGLDVAAEIFSEDEELASRSIMISLRPWEAGPEVQRLIRAMAIGLGIADPDRLADQKFAERIWIESGGVTGNIKRILRWAYKIAKSDGRLFVTQADITAALAKFPSYLAR